MPPPNPLALDSIAGLSLLAAVPPDRAFGFEILTNYLLVGAALVAIGMLGFLSRRNMIVMFLSAELMLQGVALTLVGFGRYHDNWTGVIFTIVILTVAACEAALALALILVLYHRRNSLDVTLWQDIRESGVPPAQARPEEAEPILVEPGVESYPQLTPAGIEPPHPREPWERRRD